MHFNIHVVLRDRSRRSGQKGRLRAGLETAYASVHRPLWITAVGSFLHDLVPVQQPSTKPCQVPYCLQFSCSPAKREKKKEGGEMRDGGKAMKTTQGEYILARGLAAPTLTEWRCEHAGVGN